MVTTSKGSWDIRNLVRNIKERAYFTLGLWNGEWKTTSSKKESTMSKGNKEDRKFNKRWETRYIMLIKIRFCSRPEKKDWLKIRTKDKAEQFPADWNHRQLSQQINPSRLTEAGTRLAWEEWTCRRAPTYKGSFLKACKFKSMFTHYTVLNPISTTISAVKVIGH